jgi:hypothetical protein
MVIFPEQKITSSLFNNEEIVNVSIKWDYIIAISI